MQSGSSVAFWDRLDRTGGGALLGLAGGDDAAGGAEGAEAGEEFVGGGDVFGDLGAQFFGAAKFFFFAKAFPELDFDATGRVFAERLEEMGLNA
jgi:hypothetical protein